MLDAQKNTACHMPCKVAITGPAFSGKKTLARQVCEEMGLTLFDVSVIVKEFDKLVNPPDEPEDPKAAKKGKKDEPEVNLEELEELKGVAEKVRAFQAESGQKTVPENFTAEILAIKVRYGFKAKSQEEMQAETKQRLDKERELEGLIKNFDTGQKKGPSLDDLNAQLRDVKTLKPTGYVICGFPESKEGAICFENLVNGFVPEEERQKSKFFDVRESTERIAPSPPVLEKEREPLQSSALTKLIMLEISKETLLERGRNRVIDPQTGTVYHTQFNPPPENVKGLLDRVQPIEFNEEERKALSC